MSTQKTQHYQLHSWVPEDDFHLTEINENFAKLDKALKDEAQTAAAGLTGKADKTTVAALGKLVTGTYKGNGESSQTVDLGAPILAVHIESFKGTRPDDHSNLVWGGLIFPDCPLSTGAAYVDGNTFVAVQGGGGWWLMNTANVTYYYVAWVKQ